MQFTLLIYQTAEDLADRSHPERARAYWSAWPDYVGALKEAGVFRGGAGLDLPAKAASIKLDKKPTGVQDGPFADTKEYLGGYFLIEVPGMDAALAWAARMPEGPGRIVEVRPNLVLDNS
ncbi:MAG TPA: YciI family protein [Asticcacaulis sp.]|nr:YciI family protein [Asticcacaulis sp.]